MTKVSAVGGGARRITYSPKVFIPLTMLCRDRCGYCTFAQSPAHLPSPYLPLDDVLAVARAGAEAGCHEALFTLGEFPEDRYPVAREWLDEHGYALDDRLRRARRPAWCSTRPGCCRTSTPARWAAPISSGCARCRRARG